MPQILSKPNVSNQRIASWVRQAQVGVSYHKVAHRREVAEIKDGEYLVNNERTSDSN